MTQVPPHDLSIIILTKNAGEDFDETLKSIYTQNYVGKFEVIIIDSGSTDRTIEIAKSYSTKIVNIKPEEFRHGQTRNLGASLAGGRYLVFLTQDSIPTTDQWLSNLIRNFADPNVAGVYGRQIPKVNTKPMEYFFLSNKYPPRHMVKHTKEGKTDMDLIFFSDVNSAIRRKIWEEYPYNNNIIMCEDEEWAKRVLLNNHKIVYEPEAAVYHSHNFNLKTVFQRYFDCGISFRQFAGDEYATQRFSAEGLGYVIKEFKFLISNGYVRWLPYAILYDLAKFVGLSLGRQERRLPFAVKTRFSSNGTYWRKSNGQR